MKRISIYREHSIELTIQLNSGSKIVNDVSVLTHTIYCAVDGGLLSAREDLNDAELINTVATLTTLAERRIDIIGSPEDSPLVTQLIAMGFEF